MTDPTGNRTKRRSDEATKGILRGSVALSLRRFLIPLLCCVPVTGGCRCDQSATPVSEEPPDPIEHAEDFLVFPDELRVEDESVNAFVHKVMHTCASGAYDAFRLLWSAREEPLPRDEFQQGWQAVKGIRIRALKKLKLAGEPASGPAGTEQVVYAIDALVEFEPTYQARRLQEDREVIMMFIREHHAWRLARAPKAVRTWIRKQQEPSSRSGNGEDAAHTVDGSIQQPAHPSRPGP